MRRDDVALPHLVRFFFVVRSVPNAMLWTFVAIAIGGCTAIAVNASLADRALAPVLLLQLFAAASGFRVPARRGHYDLLFASGTSRVAIGAMHWLMSTAPGLLTWCALAVAEHAAGDSALTESGTIAAMLIVSTVPWSLTVPLPRLTGAIVWLLVFVTTAAALARELPGMRPVMPWFFVGTQLSGAEAGLIVAVALGSLVHSLSSIRNMDFPLESSQ
jgi:hypothetical protein